MPDLSAHDIDLPIPCTHCGQEFEQSFQRIQENLPLTCPACNESFRLRSDHFAFALDNVDKEIRQFVLAWALEVGIRLSTE